MSGDEEVRATILDWLPRCGAFTEDAKRIAHRFKFDLLATERVLEELAHEGLISRHVSISYGPPRKGVEHGK